MVKSQALTAGFDGWARWMDLPKLITTLRWALVGL